MRFDLEIPNTNIELMFVPEGMPIPNGAIAACFVEIDDKNVLPSDMLTIDENVIKNPFSGYNVLSVTGPTFIVNSDKFLLTHISKYSVSLNAKVPLFYKLTIDARIQEDAIKIFDYYGVLLSPDEYLVEQNSTRNGSTYTDITYVYMNKPNRIMFVEYASPSGVFTKLLSLEPIFAEAAWDELEVGKDLPLYRYIFSNNTVDTFHSGILYLMYDYDISMIRHPIANLDDPWYIGILNTSFTRESGGREFSYSVPEYNIQNEYKESQYRKLLRSKCRKLIDGFIQLQSAPAKSTLNAVTIYVEDYYTKKLKCVYTSDPTLYARNYPGSQLAYEPILDISLNGIIQLPIHLAENDMAYADYQMQEDYYEFRLMDFSTALLSHGGYFTIFLLPDTTENTLSAHIANIGQVDTRKMTEKAGIQGAGFRSMDEYYEFCDYHGAYHLATIALSSSKQRDLLTVHDARKLGGDIGDKFSLCRSNSDMFYKDLIDRNILLPVNDSLIAVFDSKRLRDHNILKLDELTWTLDSRSKAIISQMTKTIQENLDVSTGVVFEFRKDNKIPPSRMISVVNGFISSLVIMASTDTTEV